MKDLISESKYSVEILSNLLCMSNVSQSTAYSCFQRKYS
jgi:hypothetical protein